MTDTNENVFSIDTTNDLANGTEVKGVEVPRAADSEQQVIAEVAYELWTRRNGRDGSPLDDWLQAEAIVRSETEVDTLLAA